MGKLREEVKKMKSEIETRRSKIQKKIDKYNTTMDELKSAIEVQNKLYVDYEINENQTEIVKVEKELSNLIKQKENTEDKIKLFADALNNKQNVSKISSKVFDAAVQEYADKQNEKRNNLIKIGTLEKEIDKLKKEKNDLKNKCEIQAKYSGNWIVTEMIDVIDYVFDDTNFKEIPPIKRDEVYHQLANRISSEAIRRKLLN